MVAEAAGMDAEFTTDVQVRYRDLDPNDHVNNAVYATYLEEVRSAYFEQVIERNFHEMSTVLATLQIDYRRAIEPDDDVTVALSVSEIGNSSMTMEYEIRTDDGVAATATTVQVVWDRETEESRPVPDEWRERIEAVQSG